MSVPLIPYLSGSLYGFSTLIFVYHGPHFGCTGPTSRARERRLFSSRIVCVVGLHILVPRVEVVVVGPDDRRAVSKSEEFGS